MSNEAGKTVTVRLVKGMRGCRERHRQSVRALGLNKMNYVRSLGDKASMPVVMKTVEYPVRVKD